MPAKLFAVALIIAGLWLRRSNQQARRRGYIGPVRRRLFRDKHRAKFQFALGTQVAATFICFVAAFIFLTGGLHR